VPRLEALPLRDANLELLAITWRHVVLSHGTIGAGSEIAPARGAGIAHFAAALA
jgi:hypothetical protein